MHGLGAGGELGTVDQSRFSFWPHQHLTDPTSTSKDWTGGFLQARGTLCFEVVWMGGSKCNVATRVVER